MAETLKRRIGPGLLTAYGVGIMVGAGIYVLTGAAAGAAGVWAPLSFALAALVAVPTALSFSELSARIPEAAGDSSYVEMGLRRHWLAVLVGAVNVIAGTVAAAAVLRGGVGYLTSILDIPFVWRCGRPWRGGDADRGGGRAGKPGLRRRHDGDRGDRPRRW